MNHRLKIIKKVHSIKRVKNLCVQRGENKINICNCFNIYTYGKEQKYTKISILLWDYLSWDFYFLPIIFLSRFYPIYIMR